MSTSPEGPGPADLPWSQECLQSGCSRVRHGGRHCSDERLGWCAIKESEISEQVPVPEVKASSSRPASADELLAAARDHLSAAEDLLRIAVREQDPSDELGWLGCLHVREVRAEVASALERLAQ